VFDVPINDDNMLEGDENFTVSVDETSLPTGVIVGTPGWATVNIRETNGQFCYCQCAQKLHAHCCLLYMLINEFPTVIKILFLDLHANNVELH